MKAHSSKNKVYIKVRTVKVQKTALARNSIVFCDSYNDSCSRRRGAHLVLRVSSGDRWITTCKDHEEPFSVPALHFTSAFPTVCSHAQNADDAPCVYCSIRVRSTRGTTSSRQPCCRGYHSRTREIASLVASMSTSICTTATLKQHPRMSIS